MATRLWWCVALLTPAAAQSSHKVAADRHLHLPAHASGVHPCFLPLVMGALGRERSYYVEAASYLPTMGAVGMSMHVQLVEVERPPMLPGVSRMFRLAVEPGSRITNKHGVSEDPNMHTHPVFFSLSHDGTIIDFHHHRREDEDTVAHKKMLASYLQLPLARPGYVCMFASSPSSLTAPRSPSSQRSHRLASDAWSTHGPSISCALRRLRYCACVPTPEPDVHALRACSVSRKRRWQQLEVDANGPATANYTVRDGLFRRVVTKEVEWTPSSDRPEELGYSLRSKVRLKARLPTRRTAHCLLWLCRRPSCEHALGLRP